MIAADARAWGLVAAVSLSACLLPFDPSLLDAGQADSGQPSPCRSTVACAGADCCEMTTLPAGTFDRGYDRSDIATETDPVNGWQPEHVAPATISAFSLDVFEVTVGRFRTFVAAYDAWRATGAPAASTARTWLATWSNELPTSAAALSQAVACADGSWTTTAGAREAWPINCVSWFEAQAYCLWQGGRLPTEAEWNYAAAGGNEQRAFPWSVPAASRAVDGTYALAFGESLTAVGSRSPQDTSRWGQHDLAGSVREWVFDWSPEDGAVTYTEATVAPPCLDCADDAPGTERVRRGGAWDTNAARLRTAYRSSALPGTREPQLGFRCARSSPLR